MTNAVGLLKEEMRRLHSVIMDAADHHSVPAGGALAVDRMGYAEAVTEIVKNHPLITFTEKEVTEIPEDGITIIATGPLTEENWQKRLKIFAAERAFISMTQLLRS